MWLSVDFATCSGVPVATIFPPPEPPIRTKVHNPVRRLDHVQVVLNGDHGIAFVHQALKNHEQLADVLKVQASGGLIEDVDAATVGTLLELGSQLYALGSPTRQSGCRLAKPDVTKAHVHQGVQMPCDRSEGSEKFCTFLYWHVEDVGNGLALVVNFKGFPVVPGAWHTSQGT